jgi:hypothetical protein
VEGKPAIAIIAAAMTRFTRVMIVLPREKGRPLDPGVSLFLPERRATKCLCAVYVGAPFKKPASIQITLACAIEARSESASHFRSVFPIARP